MQNKTSEERLAKGAYNWLRASPLVTVITLYLVASFGFGYGICFRFSPICGDDFYYSSIAEYINYGFGIIVSACWHFLLLQYVNNKDSEFVRKHGRQALIYAGIRTGTALGGLLLDFFLGASGVLTCITIIVLFILWIVQTNSGLASIKKELEENPNISRENISQSIAISIEQPRIYLTDENRAETLNEILQNLQSEDDVTVLHAISKLNEVQESNAEILKQLESLADVHANTDVRMDARVTLNALKHTDKVISTEVNMTEYESRKPEEVLNEILANLKSKEDEKIVLAFAKLKKINYSSQAIRRQVESVSLNSVNSKIRDEAREVLNLPSHRAVQKSSNTLDRGTRLTILNEIKKWINDGLLTKENADVLQSRYDFDFVPAPHLDKLDASQPTPQPASAQQKISQPEKIAEPEKPKVPAPTLLQTLTSEASIKVYLYLGAFFVIAAAAILGAIIEELRLPILILGTLLFGGLSVAIKKRLPQPSFALFIVFSFLLPITANSIELTLQEALNYASFVTSIYWAIVWFVLTVVWAFGTKFYDSKLFSITAYGAFTVGLINIAKVFETEPEIYTLFGSIAALSGLAGTWLIKKWKDANFGLPVFVSTQLGQLLVLFTSLSIFSIKIFDPENVSLWHLIPVFVWLLASVYYVVSDKLYSFVLFAWATAGALIPIPFFLAATLDLENVGSTILLLMWGIFLAVASEAFNRIESIRKYSLPFLLASFPSFAVSIITAFAYGAWLGMLASFVIAILFTALHILRTRWWLWTLALVNFVIAYFAFFQLDFIQNLNIFIGYPILLIGLLFLLPDLFLKKDWEHAPEHRLPVRLFGILLSVGAILTFVVNNESPSATIGFAILTLFTVAYTLAYRRFWLAYLPAIFFATTILYATDYFALNKYWLPIFTAVTFLYFLFGMAFFKKENWSLVFRNTSLILGTIISVIAFIESDWGNGWYVLVIGFLFIIEMVLRKIGFFEIGAPIFFSIAALLLIQDFEIDNISTQLLLLSVIWILSDILAHLFYKHPRPLNIIIRGIGGLIAIINYGFLFSESDLTATVGYAIYTLLWLTVSLLYRQPILFYSFTLTLPLFATFLFRNFGFTKWIHPVILIALAYYAIGFALRSLNRLKGWDNALLYSGLGLGVFVSLASPILGGLDASIPVAVAASLWAVEAFSKKSAWLAFPANALYLMSYFILLNELDVKEVQFFSIGAALIGLIQHYLLTRSNSKGGAFVMGMLSQFVLLGTTYFEMINKNELSYFFLLFLQSLAVLIYGLVIRSRSLTFFPIGFVVLGVFTVAYSALKEVGAIFLIGCTGILLLGLGILAVLLRERIAKLGEKLSDWQA